MTMPFTSAPIRTVEQDKVGLAGFCAIALLVSIGLSVSSAFSLAIIGVLIVVGGVTFLRGGRIRLVGPGVALLYLAYVFGIGLVIGSVPLELATLPHWISRDGRVLVALVPIIVIGMTRVRSADLAAFVRTLEVLTWLNVIVYVAGTIVYVAGTIVPTVHAIAFGRATFSGTMSSHHTAGMTFATAVLVFLAARATPEIKARPHAVTLFAAFALMVLSGSRTALVGIAVAAIWTAITRKRFSEFWRIAIIGLIVSALAVALSDKLAGTLQAMMSPELWQSAFRTYSLGLGQHEAVHWAPDTFSSSEGYIANILGRFWYWGIATGLWLRSPLVGIGSFRFNDVNLEFHGVGGFVQVATSGVDQSNDIIGAHSQFLGSIVENGPLGLALLLAIWILPYRLLGRRSDGPSRLFESGRQMIPFAFGTALTGYTLIAPALTFSCLTWLALVCGWERSKEPVRPQDTG